MMVKIRLSLMLALCVFIVTAHGQQGISFMLGGVSYTPNDVVTITDIGESASGLRATSTYSPCCTQGDWFLPGITTPLTSDVNSATDFYSSKSNNGEVILSRKPGILSPTGIYTCNIQNSTGQLTDIHIGIYQESTGAPIISSLMYDDSTRTLTCVSGGGPVTMVTWRKGCSPFTVDQVDYSQSQAVDTATTTWTTTLTIASGVMDTDGVYSCEVSNRRGRDIANVGVGGDYDNLNNLPVTVSVTPDQATPIAGQPLTMSCSHTSQENIPSSPVAYQWLSSNGSVLDTTNTLAFSSLRQSHGGQYYCVVTVGQFVGCMEHTISVQDPDISVTISTVDGNYGNPVNLICSVSGIDLMGEATYVFYKGESLLPGSSNTYTVSSVGLPHVGGDYYCEVTVSRVFLDVSGPLTVRSANNGYITVTVPQLLVRIIITGSSHYTGKNLVMTCSAGDFGSMYPDFIVDFALMGPRGAVAMGDRITVIYSEAIPDTLFSSTYTFSPLSKAADEGGYTCMGTIRPEDSSIQAFVTNGVGSSSQVSLIVVDPSLAVAVSMVTSRVLDIAPYNMFSVVCTASSSVQGVGLVALSKAFTWTQSVNSASPTVLTVGITNTGVADPTSTSRLSLGVTTAGNHSYLCSAAVDFMGPVSDSVVSNTETLVTVHGSAPPLAPVNLATSRVTHERATIGWTVTAVSYDRESFVVLFRNDSLTSRASSSVMGQENIGSTNIQYMVDITGLDMNTQYFYRVQANNSAGSTTSEETTFNTTSLGPSPPLSLIYSRNAPINYLFSWTPPTEPNGEITEYMLECIPQIGLSLPTLVSRTTNTSLTVTGDLEHGVTYTCTVTALNEGGPSAPSDPVSFRTEEIPPSGPPRQFSVFQSSIGNVVFLWEVPLPVDRNGIITKYSLICTLQDGSEVVSMVFAPASNSRYSLDGFRVVTSYVCLVRATNSAGSGPEASMTILTGEDVPGAPPTTFRHMVQQNSTSVTFSWTPPPAELQNGVLTGYHIECEGGPITLSDSGISPSASSVALDGFSPATNYTCLINATTAVGVGPSTSVSFFTLPSAPGDVVVTSTSSNQLSVTWRAPVGVVSGYVVYVNGSAHVGTTTSLTVTGLTPFTTYLVEVSAVNGAGEGVSSLGMSVTTLEDFPGEVVCSSRWTAHNATTVTLSWSPPERENGITLLYVLRLVPYGRVSEGVLAEVNVSSNERETTLSAGFMLEDGVPYSVEVYAENSVGRGKAPCIATDFNVQLTPPTPMGVTSTRDGNNITVTWDVPSLIVTKGFVSYIVTFEPNSWSRRKRQVTAQCSSSPCGPVPVEDGGVVIMGLEPGTAYALTVSPENEDNETGVAETVVAAAVDCGPLTAPPNGGVTTPSETTFMNTATYSCTTGYILTGDVTRTCGSDGMWTLAEPTCDVIASDNLVLIIAVVVVVVILIAIIFIAIIVLVCCLRSKARGKYRPPSLFPLQDMTAEEKEVSVEDRSSSQGTTSPRRQMTSPVHMTVEDFLQPIDLVEFSEYCQLMHQSRNKGFERAFESLPKEGVAESDIAKKNKSKNRFQNIYPYNLSRVKLRELPGQPGSDYINASYIDGYKGKDVYIAAQGPMSNTVTDFWRMVWEHRLETIVMLTKVKELTKIKCEMYWPEKLGGDPYSPPDSSLSINYTDSMPFADYEIRKFLVLDSNDPEARALEITQYQFLGWPDHGVPEYATTLIGFIRRVRTAHNPDGPPMLVHCSAGVGRTGTFIVLDTMLERLKVEESVNVYETLRDMRMKRAHMVQTKDQYVFINDALNELIMCGNTEIKAADINSSVGLLHKIRPGGEHVSEFNYQFQLLNQVSRKPADSDLLDALQHYNAHKNRYQDKVPYTSSRVYLNHTGADGGNYINASFVDGYKHKKAYIATQAPLAATVNDFWRMIWEFKSKAIVMLCSVNENGKEMSHTFWPTEVDTAVQFGKLKVTFLSETSIKEGLTVRKFYLEEDKDQESGSAGTRPVSLFQYTDWPEQDRPPSTEEVLKIVDEVSKVQRSTSNKPITVMCNDGMGRTGAFICIHAQVEKINTEHLVDLFQFVKSARVHRVGLIAELEHYIFCHNAVADYFNSFEAYSNFK